MSYDLKNTMFFWQLSLVVLLICPDLSAFVAHFVSFGEIAVGGESVICRLSERLSLLDKLFGYIMTPSHIFREVRSKPNT